MSRSNYDKPFYVDVGTSIVAIRCASNGDVIDSMDHHGSKHAIKIVMRTCDRMNKEAEQFYAPNGNAASKREQLPEVRANGKWKNGTDYEYEFAYCSECGRTVFADWCSHAEAREKVVNFHEKYKYCPECGAKMEGGYYVE